MDDDLEAVAVKLAATKEREYMHGWRAYVNGAKRPATHWAAKGWDEAQYADQACWRPILWSRNREEYGLRYRPVGGTLGVLFPLSRSHANPHRHSNPRPCL